MAQRLQPAVSVMVVAVVSRDVFQRKRKQPVGARNFTATADEEIIRIAEGEDDFFRFSDSLIVFCFSFYNIDFKIFCLNVCFICVNKFFNLMPH